MFGTPNLSVGPTYGGRLTSYTPSARPIVAQGSIGIVARGTHQD